MPDARTRTRLHRSARNRFPGRAGSCGPQDRMSGIAEVRLGALHFRIGVPHGRSAPACEHGVSRSMTYEQECGTIRSLAVDDSACMRTAWTRMIQSDGSLPRLAAAADGQEAVG